MRHRAVIALARANLWALSGVKRKFYEMAIQIVRLAMHSRKTSR